MSETAKSTKKAPNPNSKMGRIVIFLDEHKDASHTAEAIEAAANSAPSTRTMLHHLTMAGRVWRPEPGKYQSVLGLSDDRLKEIVAAAQTQAKQRGAGMKRGAAELVPPTAEARAATEKALDEQTPPAAEGDSEAPVAADVPVADVGEVAADDAEQPAAEVGDAPTDDADVGDAAAPPPEADAEKPATLGEVLLVALKLTGNASPSDLVKFLKTQPEADGLNITESTVRKAVEKLVKGGKVKKGPTGYRLAK